MDQDDIYGKESDPSVLLSNYVVADQDPSYGQDRIQLKKYIYGLNLT